MPRRGAARRLSAITAKMDAMPVIADSLIADLDDEQREAVLAPRGPVCVLAGAGTGKTRTITHRIAQLVATGHVAAGQVLAVTFTQRAAGEMRTRLRALGANTQTGVGAVQAMTFHAAAHRQLRYFWPRVVGDTGWQLLETKFAVVARGATGAGLKLSTDDVRDVAGEIEWAKASLISPEQYPDAVAAAARDVPLDATKVAAVYAAYESLKSRRDRGRRRGRRRIPRPLPLLRRRRVPGRHPAAAARAVGLAGRPRRPDCRRRRQPDHLFVHRGLAALPAGFLAAVPRRDRGAPGTRLPVHPAGRVAGKPGDRCG